jgi:hypothetical protein
MSVDSGFLVFAVGHLLGPFHRGDRPPAYVRIRLGDQMLCLDDGPVLAVWGLGNGVPGSEPPTTRATFEAATAEIVGPDAADMVRTLADAGALAFVRRGTPGAVRFATEHRLRSLLTAIGGLEDASGHRAIGIGGQVRAHVDTPLFDLWWHCGAAATLWQACQRVAAEDGSEPGDVLDHFLDRGHTLLSCGAAYLDVAGPGAPRG